MRKKYTKEEVTESTLKYFNGDELATNVFITKYCLKDDDGDYLELNPNDMHRRLASEFSKIESKKYSSKTKIQPLSEAEIFNLFKDFKYIIPQGSPMFAIGNDYQLTSTSNCYVLTSPEDSYGAIMHTDEELVQVSKRRGGVGIDLSKLRPKGTPTKNAAKTSTGLISFLERYSNSIREVGQDGRRGAALLSLSVKHKEIREFIESKTDLTKITGANISVKIDDEFMLAVKNDSDYELCFPIDYKEKGIEPKVSEMVKAREIWDLLIKTAHSNAEPGILFWDHHLNYNPSSCYKDYCPVSTNPCVIGKTLVLTNLGWIYIENLQKFKDSNPDLQIVTSNKEHDLTLSSLEWVDITSKQDKIYKTTFSNGEHLLSNGKHKLYRYDYKEVKVEDLEKHVVVYSGRHLVHVENVEVTERLEDVWDLTANPNYNFFSINGYDEVILEQINNSIIEDIEKELSTNDLSEITKLFRRSILSVDCGEIALSELDSCRLISMNLINYVKFPFTDKAFFEAEKYMRHVKIAQRLLDDLIDIESNIIDKIIAKVESDPEDIEYKEKELKLWKKIQKIGNDGRRTGLGLTGLADCIAMLGLKYDSEQSLEQIEKIMRIHRDGAYTSSIEMAEDLGPFVGYDYKAEENNLYIKRFAKDCPELYDRMIMNGRRNVALLTIPPAGSTSILAGGTSSGLEPVFMLSYTRRRKLDETSTDIPDFVDKNGDRWKHYEILHNTVNAWKDVVGERPIEESPWFGSTAADIDPMKRVEIQATCQKYICQSLSSTANLSADTTVQTVKDIFQKAWELGCKGFTIYREGSRNGVLINSEEKDKKDFTLHSATKRPKELPCDVYHLSFRGDKYYVVVGLWDGKYPYEIFVGKNINLENDEPFIPKHISHGVVKKIKRGEYVLINGDEKEYQVSGELHDDIKESMTRFVSLSLRHGVDILFIVDILEKSKGDMLSFSKVMARTLKRYIKNGAEVSGKTCPSCGGENLIRESGCIQCIGCGWTMCS